MVQMHAYVPGICLIDICPNQIVVIDFDVLIAAWEKNMPNQIFHSNVCLNQLETCKITDFRKLQSIVVNVISLPVMTPDKFSYLW